MVKVNEVLAVYPQEIAFFENLLYISKRFRYQVLFPILQYKTGIIIISFTINHFTDLRKHYTVLKRQRDFLR